MKSTSKIPLIDRLGALASLACLAHCILIPALLVALPWLPLPAENEAVHSALLMAVFPLAFVALISGVRRHGHRGPACLGGGGIILLVGASLVGETHGHTPLVEAISVAGSLALVTAHLWNGFVGSACCEAPAEHPGMKLDTESQRHWGSLGADQKRPDRKEEFEMKQFATILAAFALVLASGVSAHECPDDPETLIVPGSVKHECPDDDDDEKSHPVLSLVSLGR